MTQRNLRGAYMNFSHDRQADWDFLREWQPAVIHLMLHGGHTDPNSVDVNRIKRVHDTCSDALILLRVWDVDDRNFEAHNAMVANPIAEADKQLDWWNAVTQRVQGVPRNQLMAGLNNETGPEKDAALYAYTERALTRGTQLGIRLGALVFSVGRPSLPGESQYDMAYFSRLEALFLAGNHSMLLNEYMQPEGMYAVWTDAEGRERKDYSYLIGRHKRWPMNVPVILGEWGIEGILYNRHRDPNYGNSGWLNFPALWPASRYADEYVECVKQAGDNVIGICPFMSDYADRRWASADVLPAYGELIKRKELCVKEVATTHLPSIGNVPTQPVTQPTPQPVAQPTMPQLAHPVQNSALRRVTQAYGPSSIDYSMYKVDGVPLKGHNGIDYGTPAGSVIVAVDDGRAAEVADESPKGYGKYVKIVHSWGETVYAHLSEQHVQVGETVAKGEVIAKSGASGNVIPRGPGGAHLHFGMRVFPFDRKDGWGGYVNPLPHLNAAAQPVAPTPRIDIRDMLSLIKAVAAEWGIEWQLLASLAWAESSWNPDATSSAQAKGLTQLMDATWAEWSAKISAGNNPYDARQNLRVGSAYIAYLLKQTNGNVYKALHAYNFGIGNVIAGRTPPPETIEFATKVVHGRDLLKAVGA